jgi:hypothetical protein
MGTLIEERFSDLMGLEKEPEPPITEPNIIDCLLVTGCAVNADAYTVMLTGWTYVPQRAPHRYALCHANRSRAGS